MDRVVHFELPADNLERAQDFYREAFGWGVTPIPELGYALVGTVKTDENGRPTEPGGINGGILERRVPFTGPMITVGVDDIDAALAKVESLGGKTVQGRLPVGEMGFAAYFTDSEGNTVGLWENA
jgi:uncharacterized protein